MFPPIAVVGRACTLPGALSPAELWDAVVSARDLVTQAPAGRWRLGREHALCEPGGDPANRSWSDRGGYVRGFEARFDPSGFAIAPAELEGLDPVFLWTLHTAREALRDAGDRRTGSVERPRVAAIFGNLGFPSERMSAFGEAVHHGDAQRPDPRNRFMASGPPQLLARALGLGGGAFCLDAACASSLYAIKLACDRLHDGRADLVLAGAVQAADDLFLHVGFSALKALSKSGQTRPFHAEADGLVPAEGAGFVALKRLEDARRDGDTVHGVIRGVGLSNDGRGKGLLVPDAAGQARAVRQAYALAQLDPAEVSLLECHATGTVIGDATELESAASVFSGAKGLPLGSLKSNMGHLITAAGVAGLIKVLEAMRAGVRPPTLHTDSPTSALEGTPFRLLTQAEPWETTGLRVAGVSAFGFGGNNAHLIVSEDGPGVPLPTRAAPPVDPVAVVGVGCTVGTASGRAAFSDTLLEGDSFEPRAEQVELPLRGLRFPPNDLQQTLPQQLALLRAAQEALGEVNALPHAETGVFVGAEPDGEVTRYGTRWRLPERGAACVGAGDAVVPTLQSAGVVGTMPNIPANRLCSQFDLTGPGFAVSAGDASGLVALDMAVRALRAGELDAALVGGVDFSCEPVHEAAARALFPSDRQQPGDAAVVLVLKRLADAQRDGDRIYACVGTPDAQAEPLRLGWGPGAQALTSRTGHAAAASGLVHVAAVAVALHRRVLPDGRPWSPAALGPRSATVSCEGFPALHLEEHPAAPPVAEQDGPRLHLYGGADRNALLAALRAGRENGAGPCRVVIVARPDQLEQRTARAMSHLERGTPTGAGVHVRATPVGGELGFVFAGAGAAYRGMGRPLLRALPGLGDALARRTQRLPASLDWALRPEGPAPTPLQQLWGASALCQLHVELTRGVLGLEPQAVLGYSSGETNSLLAVGVWQDTDALVEASEASELFTREVGGRFEAVATQWQTDSVQWATWAVLAAVDSVQAALADEARVHLAIVHTDTDCVISGDAAACERVVETLGRNRCVRLGYDLAVHVPELGEVREAWLDLHRRPTRVPPGVRIYSNAHQGAYTPSSEACAMAILEQADRCLDLRPTVLAAWNDGVRVFIEHGPQSACSRWIREILGERDAVVVSLDRKGQGIEATLDAVAALVAAGVDVDHEALTQRLAPRPGSQPSSARTLSFAAHWPPIHLPPRPHDEEFAVTPQHMAPAPALPSALGDGWTPVRPAAISTVSQPRVHTALAHAATATLPPPVAAPAVAASVCAPAVAVAVAEPAGPLMAGFQQQLTDLARVQQQFVAQQHALHEQFLALRQTSLETLLGVGGGVFADAPVAPAAGVAPVLAAPAPAPAAPAVAPAPAATAPVPAPIAHAPAAPAAPAPVVPAPATRAPAPVATPAAVPAPVGPTFSREQLEVHASGKISELFGDAFRGQDGYPRQVRMPEPPLLLADRVVGLDAEPASMGLGTIWTETDVRRDAWYLNQGRMPAGIMIESGQADLMLISYLGVDLHNKGERVYRLLGCELTYHGDLPQIDETLRYSIHVDGHAAQGDVRLFFFHYECMNGDRKQLTVTSGQAGFFTDAELADSAGCLWTPEGQEIVASPRLDPPAIACQRSAFTTEHLQAFAAGDAAECFGPGFEAAKPHVRSPRVQGENMLLLDRVTTFDAQGGPWQRGYLKAELDLTPDQWFLDGHFKNDPCMPGTLMFEGCLQAMSVYLGAMGFSVDKDGWRFQPVPEETFQLRCRGQATPKSRLLEYEVFVEEVVAGPVPTLYADLLCTIDGMKAFHARRVALELVPAWPLDAMPELIEGIVDPEPVAEVDGFKFGYASMLACAWGRPSNAFPIYGPFDSPRRVARLPGPPYHFLSRVTHLEGPIGVMEPGAKVTVAYDVPPDAWYFKENGARTMPYAVLLEAVLQPCGWLASYVGSALTVDAELGFRNLDGEGVVRGEVFADGGTLSTAVELTQVSAMGGMIIQTFEVCCTQGGRPIYDLKTVFGFFPPAALATQAGLPKDPSAHETLARPSGFLVDLVDCPERYRAADRPRLAPPMMLMLDRVTGFWPTGGAAGLGQLRTEKDVDPGEWYFKAHFFQDPVQPGSLGIEAMIQALQFWMLETSMDAGIERPRFEPIAIDQTMSWKYRGQVLPHRKTVNVTLDVTQAGRDERGAFALANASLWVDGERIYESSDLGMRIVSGDPPAGPGLLLDPARDAWLNDHCPTWTQPALPMMSMVDLLAQGVPTGAGSEQSSAGVVVGLRDVRVKGWLVVDGPRRLRTEHDGQTVRLLADTPEGGEVEVASARVLTSAAGNYPAPPEALTAYVGEQAPSPYDTGALFHGPAFQVLESLVHGAAGASSVLRATSGVPTGVLNPALLDGATHGIPHDQLSRWIPECSPENVAYPALITELDLFGPTPTSGSVRCEVRADGFLGSPDYPAFTIQLIGPAGVWAQLRLIEACFPKGPLGSVEPHARRAFLRDRAWVPGVSLATHTGDTTVLNDADVDGSDWLPGTVEALYGTRDPEQIAVLEHAALAHELHPGRLRAALPLTRFTPQVVHRGGQTTVSGPRAGELDLSPVREFWSTWFDRDPWPVEDIYYGLLERFVGRIVFEDAEAFAAVRGKSALYLANHQVGLESLLFSIVASALNGLPTVTLAKIEHKSTWLGQLIQHCFSYPDVVDPQVMTFFDREDKASLGRIIGELAGEMAAQKRSVMVHVEGTRSLSCRTPVEKMSGAFIDMALQVGAPVVPVRFVGALPVKPLDARLEFPLGMARQDLWIGRPLWPDELAKVHYGERKRRVIDGINGLGIPNADEQPHAGDASFASEVEACQARTGISHERATLRTVLANLTDPGQPVRRLLAAEDPAELERDGSPASQWLAELARRLA